MRIYSFKFLCFMHPVKKNTPSQSMLDSWLFANVQSIIDYALIDYDFAESLAHHVQSHGWKPNTHTKTTHRQSHLMPQSREEAVAIAHWLLQTLDGKRAFNSHKTVLATWAHDYESPKDLLFGIVGLAVIGPTLGLINRKKDLARLQVVINKTWRETHSPEDLAQLVLETSHQVVAKELRMVGGNAYALHPDTAEWCLGKPHTRLYIAEESEIHLITVTAAAEHLSHHNNKADKELVAVALSPAVNDTFLQEFSLTEMV